jgi:hypothetical protein
MPRYDFKCERCETVIQNKVLRISHTPEDLPSCCDRSMGYHITQPPLVHWVDPVIEPFRAIATKDRPVISSMKENREYMARNDLVDANELGPPPTQTEQMGKAAEMQKSIDAISPSGELKKDMSSQGLLDIVE